MIHAQVFLPVIMAKGRNFNISVVGSTISHGIPQNTFHSLSDIYV